MISHANRLGGSFTDLLLKRLRGQITYSQLPTGNGSWDTGAGTTITITRALTVSGLLTAGGGLASGTQVMSAGMFKLGIATGNAGAALQFLGWAGVNKNWQISNAYIGGDVLDFTPSTVGGGSTFTTSVMTLSSAGALTLSGLLTASAGINATLAAFAAGDKYVVMDASGNMHLSAVGPAS